MQGALSSRTNRDLFSNYYLDEHLPETEEWDEVDEEDLHIPAYNGGLFWTAPDEDDSPEA